MLIEALPRTKTDAMPRLPAYGGGQAGMVRRGVRLVGERQDEDWTTLILRVRDHADRAAFALLFRHFAPRVKGFLMKSGAAEGLAEECAQDVLATVWQKAHLFDPGKASVATWIFTIARNRRIDALRKSRRPEPETIDWGADGEAPDQAEIYAAEEEARGLAQALKALPAAQRELVERAYWGDRSHGEIAAETGLPLGTIKSRIRLALERLRRELGRSREKA